MAKIRERALPAQRPESVRPADEAWAKAFGDRLRRARDARNMTQKELADRMGYDPISISRVENGRRVPGADNVDAMARCLGIPVADLFGASEDREMSAMPSDKDEIGLSATDRSDLSRAFREIADILDRGK